MNSLELAEKLVQPVTGYKQQAAEILLRQHEAIVKLRAALQWYVDEDEVMDGGKWEEENAFWLEGKRNVEALLKATEELE